MGVVAQAGKSGDRRVRLPASLYRVEWRSDRKRRN